MPSEERIAALLASYPRKRPPLTPAQEAHYAEEYRRNRAGLKGLFAVTATLEAWMHRAVAGSQTTGSILELGAGNLNHVPYEHGASVYDAVEPFAQLWHDSPYRSSVGAIYDDIARIEPGRLYDRILSIAVLEHLTDLPGVIAQCGLLLAPGGRLQAGIPTEGGLLWGMAWRSTTGVAYRLRRGDDYGRIMRHEHVNDAREIQTVLEYFFRKVTLRRYPLPFFHLSFYTYLEAVSPDVDRCAAFCRSRSAAERL
jgi:SAM-dependent methyltransferase